MRNDSIFYCGLKLIFKKNYLVFLKKLLQNKNFQAWDCLSVSDCSAHFIVLPLTPFGVVF